MEFICPKVLSMDALVQVPCEAPFSDNAIGFLNALSCRLNSCPDIRNFPDVAAFAFFCRRANLLQLKKKYGCADDQRKGRGIVFHIAPSNVPTNFAYSMISGILSGNKNIVRAPSKYFEQTKIICDAICDIIRKPEHQCMTPRLAIVRYNHQSHATALYSSVCLVRIIWGGDATIEKIRKFKLAAGSFDVAFADRYSLCVINADVFINESSQQKIARDFYNDTYLFDQNACTAPHLIAWLGSVENIRTAQKLFWESLYQLVKSRYDLQPLMAVDKMATFFYQATQMGEIKKTFTPDNLIWRVELKNLSKEIEKYRCNGGYFLEYKASSLADLAMIIDKKYQTLTYYGIEKEKRDNFVSQFRQALNIRMMPIGRSTEFSLTWDGIDLIRTLSIESGHKG